LGKGTVSQEGGRNTLGIGLAELNLDRGSALNQIAPLSSAALKACDIPSVWVREGQRSGSMYGIAVLATQSPYHSWSAWMLEVRFVVQSHQEPSEERAQDCQWYHYSQEWVLIPIVAHLLCTMPVGCWQGHQNVEAQSGVPNFHTPSHDLATRGDLPPCFPCRLLSLLKHTANYLLGNDAASLDICTRPSQPLMDVPYQRDQSDSERAYNLTEVDASFWAFYVPFTLIISDDTSEDFVPSVTAKHHTCWNRRERPLRGVGILQSPHLRLPSSSNAVSSISRKWISRITAPTFACVGIQRLRATLLAISSHSSVSFVWSSEPGHDQSVLISRVTHPIRSPFPSDNIPSRFRPYFWHVGLSVTSPTIVCNVSELKTAAPRSVSLTRRCRLEQYGWAGGVCALCIQVQVWATATEQRGLEAHLL